MPRSDACRAAGKFFSRNAFGLFLVVVGGLFLWQAVGIQRTGVSSAGDPGARIFPLLLSVALLVGGLAYLAVGSLTAAADSTGAGANWDAWLLVAALVIGLPLLPVVGFSLTMIAFATASLTRLGTRWYVAALASGLLIALVKALFTYLFEVQLPEGELWDRLL